MSQEYTSATKTEVQVPASLDEDLHAALELVVGRCSRF